MHRPDILKTVFCRDLTIRSYTERSSKISSAVKLLLLADLHSTLYGSRQEILIQTITKLKPDLILLPGDIADHRVPFLGTRLLIEQLAGNFLCCYVSGNHENWTGKLDSLKSWLRCRGVIVLEGSSAITEVRGQYLQLCGVDDPHRFTVSHHAIRLDERWKEQFYACCRERRPDLYSILLSHRPELVTFYQDSGFDLITAGHAHGGQVRLPGIANGLLAPHQGFFPRYAGGRYQLGASVMIVSRGLCLNHLPRICNPPELVTINLEKI